MAAEAEIGDEEVEAAAETPKPSRRMLIIIIAAALVLIVAGAGSAYFFLFASKSDDHGAAEQMHETFVFNLPAMTVNLNSDGEGQHFMKLTVALEVADQTVMTAIQPRLAKVVDAFQVYLRELRKSDLEGSAGVYRLKEELRRRVNVAVFPAHVESILFKEILIQ